jgi:hypothetical protein
MLTPMLHHLATLFMAGLGLAPAPAPATSLAAYDTPTCVTSLDVASSFAQDGSITVTVTPDHGSACTASNCTFVVSASTSSVPVDYHHENGRFLYLDAADSVIMRIANDPSLPTGGSIDFAVAGWNGTKQVFKPDPKITVTTGTCTGG